MSLWSLAVKAKHADTLVDHLVPIGEDESEARKALRVAGKYIGLHGTVTIADQLTVRAEEIVSIEIARLADKPAPPP